MSVDFDLFGVPIPEGRGKRGRPEHVATPENVSKVNMLLAFGYSDEDIATALDISQPTLRKHYFALRARRVGARLQLEAWLLQRIAAEVAAGNVTAMKELWKRIDKHDLALLSERVAGRGDDDQAEEPKGKKERRQEAAEGIGGKYAVPTPPRRLDG